MKFPALIFAATAFSASLFAADFSKHSLTDLQNLAGKVAPKDALDYRIEIKKRLDTMTVKDAREFMQTMHKNAKAVFDKMKREEVDKYHADVRAANQARIDSMTVKEARELGVLDKNLHFGDKKSKNPAPKAPRN